MAVAHVIIVYLLTFNTSVWTALEKEGLGANLQHFNFLPKATQKIIEEFKLPATWKLKAQLVFGQPSGKALKEKTVNPLEDRVKVFGQK